MHFTAFLSHAGVVLSDFCVWLFNLNTTPCLAEGVRYLAPQEQDTRPESSHHTVSVCRLLLWILQKYDFPTN